MTNPDTNQRPAEGTAVRAVSETGQEGYLHHGGHFVDLADAWLMPSAKALQEAQRLARAQNVDRSTVELVDVRDGKCDESTARRLTSLSDDAG